MAKRITQINDAFDAPEEEEETQPTRKTMLDVSQATDLS